jgi:hypothetical protein
MKPPPLPSGRRRGIAFCLPDDWTPEQALAVVELLDDLRERIWAHYQLPLFELIREERMPAPDPGPSPADPDEPPF